MNFIPYSRQDIHNEDIEAVISALRSDYLTQGPITPAFESAFAKLHQVPHAVAVSNATGGLHIACLALGIGPGSLVWTVPNSFVASANCALYCGATVDFVDVDPITRNISIDALRAKLDQAHAQGKLPELLIPVDFSGLPCDLKELRALADRHGFKILEDASHATGASYQGQPVGSAFADATVFSFHAVKIITSGEGGMVVTRDAALAERLRLLRSHGLTRDASMMTSPPEGPWCYEQQHLGYNYRITDFQSALGLSQLHRISAMQGAREVLADRYDDLLSELPVVRPVRLDDRKSSWHLYVIELDLGAASCTRAQVFEQMREQGIGVNVHYIPIHTQPFYLQQGFSLGDFPCSERYYQRAITLPLHPRMTESEQSRVVSALKSAIQG